MKQALLIILLVCSAGLFAQEKTKAPEPVQWTFSYELSKDKPDELIVFMKAAIEPNWHIYSQTVSADGPIPTSFVFKKDSLNYVLVGTAEEPKGEKKVDEAFGVEVTSFSEKVVFMQKIKRLTKAPFTIAGSLEFMCCNNMQCLPPRTVTFTLEVK